jgi:lipocalin
MVSMIKLLGPGAVMGGLGAAMLCGAGAAGADTGADAGPGQRTPQASASASAADKPARKSRAGSSGAASARPAAAELPALRSRVTAATVVRTSNNKPPAASAVKTAAVPVAAAVSAPVPVVPSSVPVDPAQYAGTYYEQGSVKQFFSIGLVNTKAVYTARPDGTLGVQNSGNYFFKRGLKSSITGSAVPVNATNTALNVGFGGTPSANPPGNYLIVDRAPDYSWVIVTDSSGRSGFILTRSQTIDPQSYQELVVKAQALGVKGRITPTRQFT